MSVETLSRTRMVRSDIENCYSNSGFTRVKLENGGWNYLRSDGTLLYRSKMELEEVNDFSCGYGLIKRKARNERPYSYIDVNGNIWGEFEKAESFKYGFGCVKLDSGCNYVKTDKTLLYKGSLCIFGANEFRHEKYALILVYYDNKLQDALIDVTGTIYIKDDSDNWCNNETGNKYKFMGVD